MALVLQRNKQLCKTLDRLIKLLAENNFALFLQRAVVRQAVKGLIGFDKCRIVRVRADGTDKRFANTVEQRIINVAGRAAQICFGAIPGVRDAPLSGSEKSMTKQRSGFPCLQRK